MEFVCADYYFWSHVSTIQGNNCPVGKVEQGSISCSVCDHQVLLLSLFVLLCSGLSF